MSTTKIRTRSHSGEERWTELDTHMLEELVRDAFTFIIDSRRFGQVNANILAGQMSSILKRRVTINIDAAPKLKIGDFVRSKITQQIYIVGSDGETPGYVALHTLNGRHVLTMDESDLDLASKEEVVEMMRSEWPYYIESTITNVVEICRIEQIRFFNSLCVGDKVMLVGHDDPMVIHRFRDNDRVDLWTKGLSTLLIDQPVKDLRPC